MSENKQINYLYSTWNHRKPQGIIELYPKQRANDVMVFHSLMRQFWQTLAQVVKVITL